MLKAAAFDAARFDRDGFQPLASIIDAECCRALKAAFAPQVGAGIRHLVEHPAVGALLRQPTLVSLIRATLSGSAFLYKATLFDKHLDANWLVAWHQSLRNNQIRRESAAKPGWQGAKWEKFGRIVSYVTAFFPFCNAASRDLAAVVAEFDYFSGSQDLSIPVALEIALPGFSGWCRKDGVCYVQPPTLMLAGLVALRINLDDCDDHNGPLRVLAGSHRLGRVEPAQIPVAVENHREEVITGARGDGVLMRPLLLHASSKARTDLRRRVLHLEFADVDLPGGLAWHRQLSLSGGRKAHGTSSSMKQDLTILRI